MNAFKMKSDLALDHIKQLILSGEAPPGTRITTRAVSEALGISETPVREAVKSLVGDEWLVLRPHVGAVVASVTVPNLREVYGIRAALEGLALELGGASIGPERIAEVDEVLQAAEHAVASQDVDEFSVLNRRFHALLCDTPETQTLNRMLTGLWSRTRNAMRGFRLAPWRLPQSHAEHRAIRDALVAGEIERAAQLMREHELAALSALLDGPGMDGPGKDGPSMEGTDGDVSGEPGPNPSVPRPRPR